MKNSRLYRPGDDRRLQPLTGPPQLLVSIREASEVEGAVAGGCDVIDVKDPSRGSLGRADRATWNAIDAELRRLNADITCSVALGEAVDSGDATPLPHGWQFAKLGTAGLQNAADWPRRIGESLHHWRDGASPSYRWILVVYADADLAESPKLIDLVERLPSLLGTDDWAGVLIDTFTKNGRTLLDFVNAAQLQEMGDVVRGAGKLWGIAGSLRIDALPDVLSAHPDVIGIRTAGCRDRRRDQPIDADAVRRFREAMTAASEEDRTTNDEIGVARSKSSKGVVD